MMIVASRPRLASALAGLAAAALLVGAVAAQRPAVPSEASAAVTLEQSAALAPVAVELPPARASDRQDDAAEPARVVAALPHADEPADEEVDGDIARLIDARAILDSVARTAAAARLDEPPSSIYGRAPYRLSLRGLGIGAGIYRRVIEEEARLAGLPAEIAEAVMGVESSYNPATLGAAGEIGLMQVLPSTARMLGFSGPIEALAVPETNIHYGVRYLAQAWRLAGGDLCTAVMKYRAGHGETRFSHRSVAYCLNVRARLAARGYPVSGSVPVATFGEPVGACRSCASLPGSRRVDLADLNARLTGAVSRMVTQKSRDR